MGEQVFPNLQIRRYTGKTVTVAILSEKFSHRKSRKFPPR